MEANFRYFIFQAEFFRIWSDTDPNLNEIQPKEADNGISIFPKSKAAAFYGAFRNFCDLMGQQIDFGVKLHD